jgi:hypothetical protein
MADEYVSQVTLEVNGEEITDFDKVKEPERALREPIQLMGKTGFVTVTPQYINGTISYVIPRGVTEFDFDSVEDGTLTIDKGDGARVTYTGVFVAKIEEPEFDETGKKATRKITWAATGRTEE